MGKMIIVKGKPYNMTFIVKASGSLLPIVLDASDTATIYITNKANGSLIIEKELSKGDLNNGEFKLSLTANDTNLLPYETGFAEDGSKFLSTCRAHISAVTVAEGNSEIQIPNVYVVDIGK